MRPPGDYYLGAGDDVDPNDWLDPSFLRALVASGPVKVTIADGEKKTIDLRVR